MRLITDSSCDLTQELIDAFHVDVVVPMKLNIDGVDYLDKTDITYDSFYGELLPKAKSLPKTSQTTIHTWMNVYETFPDEELLVLPVGSGLSGSYNSACVAAEMTARNNIHVVDTQTTALGLSLLLELSAARRDEGMSCAQIKAYLESIAPRLRVFAAMDTLHYLVMGGRLSKVSGALGSALNLKPVVCLKHNAIASAGKARGFRSALKLVRELADSDPIDTAFPLYFAHASNPDGAQQLRALFPEAPADAPVLQVGPIVGTHVGPGAVAIAYVAKE